MHTPRLVLDMTSPFSRDKRFINNLHICCLRPIQCEVSVGIAVVEPESFQDRVRHISLSHFTWLSFFPPDRDKTKPATSVGHRQVGKNLRETPVIFSHPFGVMSR